MTVTVENLTERHIGAVRRYAEASGKKTLLEFCKRASLSKLGAMRKVAEAYNKLDAGGLFGPPGQDRSR